MSEYIVEWDGATDIHGWKYTAVREEIVRCGDCVYHEEYSGEHWCTQHDIMTLKDMSDGFCKWGERKDND